MNLSDNASEPAYGIDLGQFCTEELLDLLELIDEELVERALIPEAAAADPT